MENGFFELLLAGQRKQELERILSCNKKTERFGLVVTEEEAGKLMNCRRDSLKETLRVEFGEGILPKLIETFCDSPYLEQEEYVETLSRLQDVFYCYKNESADLLTDEELLNFMKEQFDGVCCGSVEYLEETCLERFARAIRAGYEGGEGYGYERFSEEARWDRNLYLETLHELLG